MTGAESDHRPDWHTFTDNEGYFLASPNLHCCGSSND